MTEKRRQYAQAIYEIAKDDNQVSDYLDLSLAIIDIFNNDPKVNAYLSSTAISIEDKKKFVSLLSEGNEHYSSWLFLIIESGRSRYIRDYINEFIKIYNKENNIVKGYAFTTKPIGQDVIKRLEEITSQKTNKKVMIENKIDNELIGGIKLQVEDDIWDNSIKNKLLQLLKEGSEENE